MKAFLVPVEEHDFLESVLRTALIAAERFGSYIEGVALGPDMGEFIAADFALSGTIFDERTRRDLAERARIRFDAFMRSNDVPESLQPNGMSRGWGARELNADSNVAALARVFDLTIVGRPGALRGSPRRTTLESILFESGRPLLIAPPIPAATLGETIVVAWNGGTETARTVGLAMPFLHRAKRVIVMSVAGAMVPGPSADQLARGLALNDIKAEVVKITETPKAPGRCILEKAMGLHADLLIKGGYTQSRLRQMIFGGATSEILAEATLPVFMAH